MLNQSFSAENFRKILNIENRKGIYLEGEFYTDIADVNVRIKETNNDIKILRSKGLPKEEFIKKKEELNTIKEKLKEKREGLLFEKLNVISAYVTSPDFKLQIEVDTAISTKAVYKTTRILENILTLKQLQYNFRKLYKVKQSNRYAIISQLKKLLDDGFPKIILKTDIKEFYESIPHDKLLKKINDDDLLTNLSRKFIQQILNVYKTKAQTSMGVPREIGISPYLVELYMRDLDSRIKRLPNVMNFARYVDDIIVIFTPNIDCINRDYVQEVKEILFEEKLTMNEENEKTKVIDLSDKNKKQKYSIEYLGYKFISGYESNKHIPLTITISRRKKKRYASRLLKAFELYQNQSKGNEKRARKLLMKRIRFLMSNTRLVNNKRNVITGIYYTNSLISTLTELKALDRFFCFLIKKFKLPAPLEKRIMLKNSFVRGFNQTCISRFNAAELNIMMKNWT